MARLNSDYTTVIRSIRKPLHGGTGCNDPLDFIINNSLHSDDAAPSKTITMRLADDMDIAASKVELSLRLLELSKAFSKLLETFNFDEDDHEPEDME